MVEVGGTTIEDEVGWFLTPGHPRRAEIRVDPYPFYERLRTEDPVHRSAAGPWLVSRYDDVLGLLQDTRLSRDIEAAWRRAAGEPAHLEIRPAQRLIRSGMLWRDPPDHTRLRRLVQRSFAPSVMARWNDRIVEITRELVEEMRARDSFDLLHDFAMKLPGIVISEMIGMPIDRLEDYERWGAAAIDVQEPTQAEDVLQRADAAALECLAYFDELIEAKRRKPGDDIVSSLLEADRDEEVHLTHDEIVGMCILLHIAGHETTSNVVTNGMYLLLSHPDEYQRLRDDPTLLGTAIEEILRFDGSARNTMPRWANEDFEIGNRRIAAGEQVIGLFGAAHRDPSRFADPDRFDITRADNAHIGFGFGIHFCLGARLARIETDAALRLLAIEGPELRLATDEVVWRDSVVLRALTELPVAWV